MSSSRSAADRGTLFEGRGLPARTILGIDASLTALKFCISRRRDSHFHFSRAAGEHLPFRDHSVDLVILVEVIEHLPEPELTLREIARVCARAVVSS